MRKQAAKEITIGALISVALWVFGIIFSGKYVMQSFVNAHRLYYLTLLFPVLALGGFILAGRISAVRFSGRLLTASIVSFVFIAALGPFVSCAQTLTVIIDRYVLNDNIPLMAYVYLCAPILAGIVLAFRMANRK